MTPDEIAALNAEVAVKVFGLVEGENFGEWPEHDCYPCDYLAPDGGEIGAQCHKCSSEFDKWALEWKGENQNCTRTNGHRFNVSLDTPCIVPPPDFIGDPRETERAWEWIEQRTEHLEVWRSALPEYPVAYGVFCHVVYPHDPLPLSANLPTKSEAICRAAIALAKHIAEGKT